jgi:hypothetical protein
MRGGMELIGVDIAVVECRFNLCADSNTMESSLSVVMRSRFWAKDPDIIDSPQSDIRLVVVVCFVRQQLHSDIHNWYYFHLTS